MHDVWSLRRRKKTPHIAVALSCGGMINPEKKDESSVPYAITKIHRPSMLGQSPAVLRDVDNTMRTSYGQAAAPHVVTASQDFVHPPS